MKKTFTKLFSTALFTALTFTGFAVQAQITTANADASTTVDKTEMSTGASAKKEVKISTKAADADTSWKPLRRLWGYTFGDFYYNDHADQGTGVRGAETNYNGVPTYRNAFQFRRVYLGYDYDITKKFRAELLLASEPSANTGVNGATSIQNGDNLVDSKMAFYIKNINLRWMNIFNGTDFVIGEMATPGFALNEAGTNGATSLSETTWGYRFIEKTVSDFHRTNSYDVGASLQGTFDPATKNFGYVAMIGNNTQASLSGAANPNTGFYKIFYGDLWAKFFNKKIVFDIYADYAQTSPATAALGAQSHSVFKAFAAYTTPKLSIGVEAYTQKLANAVTNTSTPSPEDATVNAISVWVKGAIVKDKVGFFARYDGYNPDTQFNTASTYTANSNGFATYNPTVKETFYTAGLDFTPTKNVHFAPNIWLVNYTDQRNSATTGYVAPDHNMVYRLTFYYVFGK